MLGFIEYNKERNRYGIEPFMLELKDGISVQEARFQWLQESMYPCQNLERNIEASNWVMSNLYTMMDID